MGGGRGGGRARARVGERQEKEIHFCPSSRSDVPSGWRAHRAPRRRGHRFRAACLAGPGVSGRFNRSVLKARVEAGPAAREHAPPGGRARSRGGAAGTAALCSFLSQRRGFSSAARPCVAARNAVTGSGDTSRVRSRVAGSPSPFVVSRPESRCTPCTVGCAPSPVTSNTAWYIYLCSDQHYLSSPPIQPPPKVPITPPPPPPPLPRPLSTMADTRPRVTIQTDVPSPEAGAAAGSTSPVIGSGASTPFGWQSVQSLSKSRRQSLNERQISFGADTKPASAADSKVPGITGSACTSTTAFAPPAEEPPYSVFQVGWKRIILGLVTMTAFLSPMTSNIYMSAIPSVARVRVLLCTDPYRQIGADR